MARILAIGIAAGTVVVAVVAYWWRPDELAALTLVPAWLYLLAGIVPGIALGRLGYRRLVTLLVAGWLLFAIAYVEESRSLLRLAWNMNREPAEANRRGIRVVSLNCAGAANSLVDLAAVKPDVVLLQEALGENQLARLASDLFGEAGSYLSGGDTAIVARGLITPRFVDHRQHFVVGLTTFDDGREIECVSLRLAPPPARFDCWAGGFWIEHRNLRHTHQRQLRRVREELRSLMTTRPVVVGGDFNTTPRDTALDELRPEFIDAFAVSGAGWGATGTNDWPLFRVDQIWTDSRGRPLRTWVAATVSSDHRMIVSDFELRDNR